MPLLPGKANIGRNIKELTKNGSRPRSHDQIVAIAMAESRRHPQKRAAGGIIRHSDSGMPAAFVQGGFIHSEIPGRTDLLPTSLPPGSHILPADTLSGIGQGNSQAGAKMMRQAVDYSLKQHAPGNGMARGGAQHGHKDKESSPVILAGGEMILTPDEVAAIGGGDATKGHDILDKMILDVRKKTAAKLRRLPGPKK